MPFTAELSFFCRLMKNRHIDTHIIAADNPVPQGLDRNLRSFLKKEDDYYEFFSARREKLKPQTLYRIRDGFKCAYYMMLLPDGSFLSAGPYLCEDVTHAMIAQAAAEHSFEPEAVSQLVKYFGNLVYISDDNDIYCICATLAEAVWGETEFSFESINPEGAGPDIEGESFRLKSGDSLLSVSILEERYAAEAQMMKAVSQGMLHKVEQIFSKASGTVFEMRTDDPVRNMKNYLIISNTLMRKAAEYGSVHPFYIDGISTDFARKIEQVKTVSQAGELMREMARKYCALVKNHSMKDYSLLVQRTLTVIDSDLTADLGLKHIASLLNVNASYLSALFKKETGKTLTDFVNRKRIDHAAYLLRTTPLQVQTVAQQCGIFDVNYFAKMFKKYMGKTPKAYRDEI